MKITRVWAMPNKWTFTIDPIARLMAKYVTKGWVDPFAGENSPDELTNDLNPERPTTRHEDGLAFLMSLESSFYEGVLYDPPYSFTQAKECYDSYGSELFNTHDNIPNFDEYDTHGGLP